MKIISRYKCELCGNVHDDPSGCSECEKRHRIPESIGGALYKPVDFVGTDYPEMIVIKFDDGKSVRYRKGWP